MKRLFKIYILVTLCTAVVLFGHDNIYKNEKEKLPQRGICAHRGASQTYPENTIPSFKEAIRLGAHMIEFDVRLTKDEIPVIMHDASIDRTTNGSGLVESFDLHELKEFDCGSWKSSQFSNVKIPTLSETLDIMPKNIWLNIHLKGDEKLGIITARLVIAKNREHQSVIACNEHAAVGARSVSNNLMLCNMDRAETREQYVKETIEGGFKFIQLLKRRDSGNFTDEVELLQNNGISINYYGANTNEEVVSLLKIGVDFVLVDKLRELMNAAENAGIKRMNYE